ncbi:MAG TPA: TylF/MycF/NovP-related O-methyltransferase [Candidatus Sulfotelmatobacter sp.]|nr:TylF/MycF/NovP-related O-methyltransferase [Candidatus Sulfotelmatobacter sp.]
MSAHLEMPRTSRPSRFRQLAKKSRILRQAHWWFGFFREIPAEQLRDREKLNLILRAAPHSNCRFEKLSALYDAASALGREGVPGSFVECGVRNGGSAAVLAAVAARQPSREVWLFDSWEGLPAPSACDVAWDGQKGYKGQALGYRERAERLLFGKMRLDPARVHLVEGWFEATLPASASELAPVALLNLDCDWYKSVEECLEMLFPLVAPGGYIFVDDYQYWQGCRKATDEFLEKHPRMHIQELSHGGGIFFRKIEPLAVSAAAHP